MNTHCLLQLAVFLFVSGITPLPIFVANAEGRDVYFDDTHALLRSGIDREAVSGYFSYDDFRFSERADGKPFVLDARNASFVVANSKNTNPTYDYDCEIGSQPVNPYPVKIYDPDLTSLLGGFIDGEIPQDSDWKPTYCNSAAVILKDAACGTVDGVRITSAWDGIRAGPGSPDLTVKNSWISNVRDDVVENDDFLPMVFEDNLVDGTFQGISIHSGGDISTPTGAKVEIHGSVIRIREYLYKGKQQYGSLFKDEDSSPTTIIHDTVVAVDYNGGSTWGSSWDRTWSKIEECSNNLFLWLSDKPIDVPLPPACFTVLTGAKARSAWTKAKQNWINCHPEVARTSNDPASNPKQCVANTFGGYSRFWANQACDQYCH